MRRQRTKAQEWRPEAAPEDSAPPASEVLDLAALGVTRDQARDMLTRQMCPLCGEGPWQSPLNHVARKHGIGRHAMRDLCGLSTAVSVVDPELRERFADNGRARDMSPVTEAGRGTRRKYRMTEAGKRALTANLADVTHEQRLAAARASKNPEAIAKQAASLKAWWASLSPEERARRSRDPR